MSNVYFVGSSGCGKTTMANMVSQAYGLPVLPSAARDVAARMGFSEKDFGKLLQDKNKFTIYQKSVALRQMELEKTTPGPWVSTRAFDCLVYEALYGGDVHGTYNSTEMQYYMKTLSSMSRAGAAVIFFIRPDPVVLGKAQEQDCRQPYLVWEDVLAFDGAMKLMLRLHNIVHYNIGETSLVLREMYVRDVLASPGWKEKQE